MAEFVRRSMQPGLEGPRYAMRELPQLIAGQFGELERLVEAAT